MKKNWHKKREIQIAIIIACFVIISFFIPTIINAVYFWGAHVKTPNTFFAASDILSFYGSLLSFIGTIVLGWIAIMQNKKLHSLSDDLNQLTKESNRISSRMLDIEEARFMPILSTDTKRVTMRSKDQNSAEKLIRLPLRNVGDSDIKFCTINKVAPEKTTEYFQRVNYVSNISKMLLNVVDSLTRTLFESVDNDTYMGSSTQSEYVGIKSKGESLIHEFSVEPDENNIVLSIKMQNIYGTSYIETIAFELAGWYSASERNIEKFRVDVKKVVDQ